MICKIHKKKFVRVHHAGLKGHHCPVCAAEAKAKIDRAKAGNPYSKFKVKKLWPE